MHPDLSFEQAPPISVPYRFFLTAPLFGVAAGVLLAVFGDAALTTRWAPETLALTHLLTAGFMLQAMCGALLQFVPVAAGANVRRPHWVAWAAHPSLLLGAILLVAGFLGLRGGLHGATAFLLFGVLAVVVPLTAALWRVMTTPALVALRLAALSLAVTAALGAILALALGAGLPLPLLELTGAHVAFGLGSWSLVLLMGVSSFVVPMFQLTAQYPAPFLRIAPWLAAVLAAFSLVPLAFPATGELVETAVSLGLLAVATVYAGVTIRLQMRRRRRITDPTFWFFRGGMVAACCAFGFGLLFHIASADWGGRLLLSVGVCALAAIVSAINGMLYKIVPFINWLHLQRLGQRLIGPAALPPNMRAMIPEKRMRGQMQVHFVAFGALFAAVWLPSASRVAGVLLVVSFAWLATNLIGGMRRYGEFRDRILADASRRES